MIVAEKEIEREYRLARQTLSIHGFLRDGFRAKQKTAEAALLVCSIVFCTTTFAGNDLYRLLKLSPSNSRFALGIASVLAFASSLLLLLANWNDQWAQHQRAAEHWARVVEKFRTSRSGDGTWPEPCRNDLNAAYWQATREVVVIPEQRFNHLKRKYLRKVALSELESSYPGCPALLLRLLLALADSARVFRRGSKHADQRP